jgi:uncharacterized protein
MAEDDIRLDRLRSTVRSLGSAAVAFSGGADSALVSKIAYVELGERAAAVTVDSPLQPKVELRDARTVAKAIGIRHVVVKTNPLDDQAFRANPPDRCYICKLAVFNEVRRTAERLGLDHVLDGSNADDAQEHRPGAKARDEFAVRSPLAEAGIGKAGVTRLSRKLRLATANKTPGTCLATRVPYGDPLTKELLARIDKAEAYLSGKGFDQVRVRAHGDMARLEVSKTQVPRLARPRTSGEVARRLKGLGFRYVTIDMEGYRSGSMDEVLTR